MDTYKGKHVVITGGTSGIGKAAAKLLLDHSARVLVTAHAEKDVEPAQQELGPNAIVVKTDIGSLAELDALAKRAKLEFGNIDALLLSAGSNDIGPFDSMTEEVYDRAFAINAKGPYFAVQKLSPMIREGGSVVFVTSVSNVKGQQGATVYAATKAAQRSMVRTMARELSSRKIRVNAMSPGPVETGILEKGLPKEAAEKARQQMTETNPMKRFGEPLEAAKAMIFLAFEATFTTGAELPVDGGASQL